MKIHQAFFSFSLILLLSSISTLAQSPASSPKPPPKKPSPAATKAPAPAQAKPLVPTLPQSPESSSDSSTPDDITRILKKAKVFTVLGRLLKTTEIVNNVNSQLITAKSGGLTILAPDDGAFSELKAGFLNSLNNGQKIELLQFHILPVFVASNNFDSLNNPAQTLAGIDDPARLQLNVTSFGDSVNITTGVVNATIKGVVYSNRQLAIYRLDKVLLPMDLVLPKSAPAAAPASLAKTPKTDKEKPSEDDDDSADDTSQKKSGAGGVFRSQGATLMSLGVALVVGAATWC